jgi:hypothetical protein
MISVRSTTNTMEHNNITSAGKEISHFYETQHSYNNKK